MLEVKEPKQFLELYNRFLFRNRMFLKSKKTDEMIYFSHPFEDSIIYIRKRKAEESAEIVEENIELEEEDEDLFDEYDRYGDDEDDTDDSAVEENKDVEKVDNSIESKLLRYSIDDMNTWKKYNENDVVNYVVNQKVYICDIFGCFCYELNIFNHSILMAEFKKINSEFEYYNDSKLYDDYYIKTEENFLCGVKILPDSEGNPISKENVKFDAVEFYGEKFVNKFMELNSDDMGAHIAQSVLERTQKHSDFLAEFSKKVQTIEMFGDTFYIEEDAKSISKISMYSKLGNECCKEHTCLSWFKEKLEELNLPEDENYFDELKNCFEYFGIYLNSYFEYVFHCDKHLQSTSEFRDAYNAIDFFFEEPLHHPKNHSTFSAYLTEKSKLQFINYLQTLIEDHQKFLEEYKTYQENTGDFSGSFIGGGFGVKGAVKGMLTASVANVIESGIYQAIEYGSMKHKYVIDALKEFARTQASKDFLLKLMEIDCKLMTYALPAFFYDKIDQFFNRYTGKEEEDRFYLISSYFEASMYYTVYLAKKYKLNYIPRYEDENGKKLRSLSNNALLENAISIFPYETEYYIEYLNAAPDKAYTYEFLNLMRAFDVDESIIKNVEEKIKEDTERKAEEERLLAERKEKERRELEEFLALKKEREEAQRKAEEALEAAEKERLAEERRIRQEKRKKYLDELTQIYGDFCVENDGIFVSLMDKVVYNSYFKKAYSSTDELIADVDKFISTKSAIVTKLFTKNSPKFSVSLQKAKSAYVTENINDGDAIVVFDATLFGNCKNGFIITKDAVWAKGMLSGSGNMQFCDIANIVLSEMGGVNISNLDKNPENIKILTLPSTTGEIGELVISIIVNLMYIIKTEKQIEKR